MFPLISETESALTRSLRDAARGFAMETQHSETVIDKAVNFVKDALGIPHEDASDVVANPEYHDSEPELAAEDAMRLDPNAYRMKSLDQMEAESVAGPIVDPEAERVRREVDQYPREKTAFELNAENARAEENGSV
jgi:hypothetical protein